MVGNQAENSKIKRLEAALIQSKSEIQSLYSKIEDLDKEKVLLIITMSIIFKYNVYTLFFKENLGTKLACVGSAVIKFTTTRPAHTNTDSFVCAKILL